MSAVMGAKRAGGARRRAWMMIARRAWRLHALGGPVDARRSFRATAPGASTSATRHAAFEQLVTRYEAPLLDFLYGMTRDREWAADLVQETFLKAYSAASDVDTITYPQAWLYRVATNTAINAFRRRKRFTWLSLTQFESDAGAERSDRWARPSLVQMPYPDMAASVAERDAVWSVLAELPPRWRAVLLLQATAGFTVDEIANQLGLTEANVRKMLFRAKERFRAIHARLEAKGGAR